MREDGLRHGPWKREEFDLRQYIAIAADEREKLETAVGSCGQGNRQTETAVDYAIAIISMLC